MTRGEDFQKKDKCKQGPCSLISISAWCDLNRKGNFLKLPDFCPNSKCKRHKRIKTAPRQFVLEGNGFEIKMEKIFKGTEKAGKKFSN